MATRWRRPLAAWEQTFRAWIGRPEPQALLEAEVFLDFRAAHGGLSLEPLERVVREAADQSLFLSHMARAALRFRPPLGLVGRVRAEHGRVDLKRGGLAALVLLARLVSLASRSPARSTVDRLRVGAQAGVIGHETAEALIDAFRLLMRLRLREQLRSLAAGSEPGNAVALATLTSLEQRRLREAFRAVAEAQKAVGLRFHAAPE
jgi:CBS domain-containing protein